MGEYKNFIFRYMRTTKVDQMSEPASTKLSNLSGNNKLANIWKVYFNFAWFLGVGPFRIMYDKKLCKYKAERVRLQYYLCVLLSSITILYTCGYTIESLVNTQGEIFAGSVQDRTGLYFEIVSHTTVFIMSALTFKELWFNQQDILKIINFLNDPDNLISDVPGRVILLVKLGMIFSIITLCGVETLVKGFLLPAFRNGSFPTVIGDAPCFPRMSCSKLNESEISDVENIITHAIFLLKLDWYLICVAFKYLITITKDTKLKIKATLFCAFFQDILDQLLVHSDTSRGPHNLHFGLCSRVKMPRWEFFFVERGQKELQNHQGNNKTCK